MLVNSDSKITREAVLVGWEHHWPFRILARACMIDEPIRYNDWLFIPEDQDTSIIPYEASKRVDVLRETGFNVVGTIVAHEAPKQLMAPPKPKRDWKIRERGTGVGKVVVQVAIGVLAVMAAIALTLGYAIAYGIMIDPALIAVIKIEGEDNYIWVQVATWVE